MKRPRLAPTEVEQALLRVKRKVLSQRLFYVRISEQATSPLSKERAFGELNVCNTVLGYIEDELKRAKEDA